MNRIRHTLALILLLTVSVAFAAQRDTIAIAEPVAKGGVSPQSIEMLWDMLETSVRTLDYDLISRASLKDIMTEADLASSSGLINPNSKQLATLGKVKGVKYLLVTSIGQFGSRLNLTLKLLDCSTGDISQNRSENLRVADLDELADKLEPTLNKLFSDTKTLKRSALLMPILQLEGLPENLDQQLYAFMGSCLLQNDIALQNLTDVTAILKKNKIRRLETLEPALCHKLGKLLEVEFLIQSTINRFSLTAAPFVIAETGAQFLNYAGAIGGTVKVIETATGRIAALLPFEMSIDSRAIGFQNTMGWQPEDFYKYMIFNSFAQQVLPGLVKVPGIR